MRKLLFILLVYLSAPFSVCPQDAINPWLDLPYIGFITSEDRRYLLIAELGVEQWENGKRSERIHQVWYLQCEHPPYAGPKGQTHCSLDRTMIMRWDMPGIKTSFYVHKHTTDEGTLQLKTVDWERGNLQFTIVYVDGTTTEVVMQLTYLDDAIFLESFHGLGVAKSWFDSTLTAVEYKIPEYGYTLNVPVEMRGFKEESRKRFDDLLNSFSEDDRRVWQRLRNDPELFALPSDDALRIILPAYDQIEKGVREPTAAEWKKVIDFAVVRLRAELARAGMSAEARERLIDLIEEHFARQFLRRPD